MCTNCTKGDHSPDNVKLPDNFTTCRWQFVALQPTLSVTHIMLVLLRVVGAGIQQCMIQNENKNAQVQQSQYAANNKQF